jgi:hypothetical protein
MSNKCAEHNCDQLCLPRKHDYLSGDQTIMTFDKRGRERGLNTIMNCHFYEYLAIAWEQLLTKLKTPAYSCVCANGYESKNNGRTCRRKDYSFIVNISLSLLQLSDRPMKATQTQAVQTHNKQAVLHL